MPPAGWVGGRFIRLKVGVIGRPESGAEVVEREGVEAVDDVVFLFRFRGH